MHRVPALAFVLALAAAGCHKAHAAAEKLPEGEVQLTREQIASQKIELTRAEERDVEDVLLTGGKIAFDDMQVAHEYSPVTGRVVSIEANLGQRVKKGDVLAVLESPDIGRVTADLREAKSALTMATHDVERQRSLFAAHATSQRELEKSEDAYLEAKAEYDRAAQKARMLATPDTDVATQRYTLRASIDGEVVARAVSPGLEVAGLYGNGTATELFTVGRTDPVWVIADVYEVDLHRVHLGAKMMVQVIARPDETVEGTVDWISGTLDAASHTAKVRCTLGNPTGALRPEMYATIQLSVDAHRALVVPRTSVVRLGDQTFAFVQTVEENAGARFVRVPITADEAGNGPWVPVTHGIEPGAKVVSAGALMLSAKL